MNPGTDWIDQARRVLDALGGGNAGAATSADAGSTEDPSIGAHTADCRWCPVCQAAAVLRGERPEVTAALADVLTATAAALRAFAADPHPPTPRPDEGASDGVSGADAAPAPVAQRIDIA